MSIISTSKSESNYDFKNKVVLVLGGSRGIGLQVCKEFLKANAIVYCASRTNPNFQGINHIECDVGDELQLKSAFDQLKTGIDFLINVAGTNLCEPIENIDVLEWDRVLDTNLKSFFIASRLAVAIMRTSKFGRIVNVSSIAGRHKSAVSGVHYTASKAGIIGLTRQLSHEVAKYNILVNCVCPGQTRTEMLQKSMTTDQMKSLEENIPIGRIADAREQAMPILFLCSEDASYITGAVLDINGGQY
tara:strand:- start:668 stop:1405 length:738 start_codon:yes stop_codon:yes gene_type:complete